MGSYERKSMTQIDFLNRSLEAGRPDVVFFHKDELQLGAEVLAWKVIKGCSVGWRHPFRLSTNFELGLVDTYGNYSLTIPIQHGNRYTLIRREGGPRWTSCAICDPSRIEISNGLEGTAVGCVLSRNSKQVAPLRWLAPGAEVGTYLGLDIWVGAVWRTFEGETLGGFELQVASTRLDFASILRAEVWMLGGGFGPSAKPLSFHLRSLG